MAKYINADAFKNKYSCCGYLDKISDKEFDDFPVSDVVPVVYGYWNVIANCGYKCSNCGYEFYACTRLNETFKLPKYCQNCGAIMDGDK